MSDDNCLVNFQEFIFKRLGKKFALSNGPIRFIIQSLRVVSRAVSREIVNLASRNHRHVIDTPVI